MNVNLSEHARMRMSQRGVTAEALQTVIEYGDREIFVGKGCSSISLSSERAMELAQGGEIQPSLADRVANLFVVVASDLGEVVTVVRPRNKRAARSYQKVKGYKPNEYH